MPEERAQRRLAAILAADVVGYSRLMEQDEAGTLAALKARRSEVLQPIFTTYRGRIVKLMGDGVLVEFASAVDAVECAVQLQEAMDAVNTGQPEDRRIVLRVGVNLGDVIVEGDDLYGEGVNIAARLEALAEPGGVYLSQSVLGQVRAKVAYAFEDLGEQKLKNMAEPVRVYKVSGAAAPTPKAMPDNATPPLKPSIAVLPFTNMSGDREQEYFSDGITEDIITELSRFRDLAVVARNSSFAYKGRSLKAQEIARYLNAAYLVSGSVRKTASRIRITAQLIDLATGNHLWAEHYDQDIEEIFAIQDDMVAKIATRVAGQVAAAGTQKARRKRPENLAAYDYVLRALEHWRNEEIDLSDEMSRKAITADPDYAWAHARVAFANLHKYFLAVDAGKMAEGFLAKSLEAAKRAVALDGNDSECHRALAQVHLFRKSFELAKHHFDAAMTLNPNNVWLAGNRATFEIYLGRPQVALEIVAQAELLDRQLPNHLWEARGLALYQMRRYREAADAFERMTATQAYADWWRAACQAQLGHIEAAQAIATEALNKEPQFSLSRFAASEPYLVQESLDHLIEGMRKAGAPA